MWNDVPLDPPHTCAMCKRDGACGPFWIGPVRPTGTAGMFGPVEARVQICRECLFVAVNEPDSPFHGLIPIAEKAVETEAALRADAARLAQRVAELEADASAATPETIGRAAVASALAELVERGMLFVPEPVEDEPQENSEPAETPEEQRPRRPRKKASA